MASDGVVPRAGSALEDAVCEHPSEAHEMHTLRIVMREYDEQDPKNPRPITTLKKRTNPLEASEALPWSHIRKDDERDRHRHI